MTAMTPEEHYDRALDAFAGASSAEWQGALLAGRFTPLAQHLPEAPPRWQEFFARALALEPAPRPNSAREFLAAFEQAFA